ncbi:MAG: DUF6231 family protein, partial [Gammaproteobacteria bacterium]|nr:DUF6231 family protein [Gammaproteobacteria bacterium]
TLAYRRLHPDCGAHLVTDAAGLTNFQTHERYDFGYIANTLEYLDKTHASSLVASLRDVLTREFCVIAPIKSLSKEHRSRWEPADFIALGLSLVNRHSYNDDQIVECYSFNIAKYKHTPDWLNPKHWANPLRWDKERW